MATTQLFSRSASRTGVEYNDSISNSSQGGVCSDSFNLVEFESLFPQATSAAIASAALFVASHAMDQTQRTTAQTELAGVISKLGQE